MRLFAPVLAFVDLETTGGAAASHRVIEVGIVLLDRGVVVEEWSSLVNPGCDIPHGIAAITGIDTEMVARAPRFEELGEAIAHIAFYAGWPAAMSAAQLAYTQLIEKGQSR